ncbi:MAG: lipopolysaccharide biosynthesis protein [Chloroflexi bacterium OHK40]
MSDLRGAATRGVRWSALSQFVRQALLITTTLLLSRLVGPAGFGLISMALTVTGFLELFRDPGTGAAVVQRRELSPALLSTIFWINLGAGLACAAVVIVGAPLAAAFYREPALTPVLRALAPGFVLGGLGVVPQALLQRAVAFRALAGVELASSLAGAGVAVALALAGAGVWSLVAQSLVTTALATPLAWLASRWRPALVFDRGAAAAVSGFSTGLVGFNLVNYFARNADYLLIGRFLGPTSLGLYTLAYRLMFYPIQTLGQVGARVLFPVFSQVDDAARFGQIFLRLSALLFFLAAPVYVGLGALADPLVAAVLGSQWAPVAPLLVILAPVGLFQVLTNATGLIYQARGRTDLMLAWGVGSSAVMMAAFALGLPFGITGVATAYALSMLLLAYPVFKLPFRLIGLLVVDLLRAVGPGALCAAALLVTLLGLRALLAALPPLALLAVALPVGALVYLVLSWRLNREPVVECLRLAGLPTPPTAGPAAPRPLAGP